MEKHEMGHRSDEITAYLSETLEPDQKASFEAHLDTCEECQGELAAQQALFSDVNEALAFKPKRTIDEQVARFEREVAAERASGKATVTRQRAQRRWAMPAAAVALAACAAGLFLILRPSGGVGGDTMAGQQQDAGAEKNLAAPQPQLGVDAGMDGGVVEKNR